MTGNVQLDDAIIRIEDLLNSSKASIVIEALRELKNNNLKESISLE